jgi:hypothetical protein
MYVLKFLAQTQFVKMWCNNISFIYFYVCFT